jgi:carboxyl-terminal processing protease
MKKQPRERITWISLTAVVLLCTTLLIFAPGAFADSSNRNIQRYISLFEQVFRFVHENYVDEVEPEVLFEGALNGLFDSLDDPHSTYLTENEMQDLTDTTSGKFGGVGLYISKSERGEGEEDTAVEGYSPYVRVVAPIEDTPAAKAGIHAGDLITAIEGDSTEDMDLDEVVDRLRGTPGTDVSITILRGEDIDFPVTLTRAVIEVPTTKHDMIPGGIGYLRIIQFTPLTDERVLDALKYFKRQNFNSLIIDVRNNPGGLLTSVVDVTDFFLPGGIIVSTRSRIPSENMVYTADPEVEISRNIPIVVLIDKGSASASEILAGALKDRDRAYLIGETTFGKGSVQQIKYIGEGGFKLTMSRYYTPSGTNIDKIGIAPDKEVKEPELNEEERASYRKLLEEQTIADFVENSRPITSREIDRFIEKLRKQGIVLEERILRKLVRNEIHKTNDSPPVYDLEYDLALQEAVEMLKSGKIH